MCIDWFTLDLPWVIPGFTCYGVPYRVSMVGSGFWVLLHVFLGLICHFSRRLYLDLSEGLSPMFSYQVCLPFLSPRQDADWV